MSATPFGEHLKREREMRGVSLDEISAATRISTRFLEALESEQWDRLPGGAFNRGFIRSIARFLGIDEDALIAEYAFERKDAEAVRSPGAHAEKIPRNWQPAALAIVVTLLMVAAGLFGYRRYGTAIAARLHSRFAGVAADSRSGTTANPAGPATDSASGQTPAADASSLAPPLDLTVRVSKPVDATVVADGKTVFAAILQPGDTKQFQAQDSLEIDSSEPSVLILSLNGRAIPWTETPGQPGKITLTHKDLQPAAEAAH
ncbi:MAG TPA: RodZ domain-containing protein [Candidatus Acidoferrum sp.]|nr:RodZ domain-containing protein [Candidatus Acidoferrum sp.]